jgi:RimJ/RimL family protein N-acetyltransferase
MMLSDGQEMTLKYSAPFSFESSRLIYRGIEKDDVDFFYRLCQDTPAVSAMNPNILLPNSKKGAEELMNFINEHALLGVIICLPPSDAAADDDAPKTAKSKDKNSSEPVPIPVGHIMLSKPTPTMAHHRNCEIGIGMLKDYRGKGYGSEAILWILNWGFRMANMHRIALECFEWNEGAVKLYKKLGFTLEGRKREFLWFDGRWHDKLDFSMLEDEWRGLQKKAL